MATDSRDETLMNFMECTGLQDFEECMKILEQHQWDFRRAINAFQASMEDPSEVHHSPAATRPSPPSSVIPKPAAARSRPHPAGDQNGSGGVLPTYRPVPPPPRVEKPSPAAASRAGVRELNFEVHHNEQQTHIALTDNQTVFHLREKIFEDLNIPIQQQRIIDWSSKQFNDRTPLKDLKLPKDNTLHIINSPSTITHGRIPAPPPPPPAASASGASSRHSQPVQHRRAGASPARAVPVSQSDDFPITVRYEDPVGRLIPCELVLRPTMKFSELKSEMEKHSKIPVREQLWRELPTAQDRHTLIDAGIARRANLTLRRREITSNVRPVPFHNRPPEPASVRRREISHEIMEVDNDDDAPEIVFEEPPSTVTPSENRELLIPDGANDDVAASENFNRVFHLRYNATGPFLYMGPLQDAVQASLLAPLFDRRPLVICLHHDRSICANVFCIQVLCCETIIEYLANNFIVWAWDLTSDTNQRRFYEILRRATNLQHIQRIISVSPNNFPLLLVLSRNRGTIEISSVIQGQQTVDEVLDSLTECRALFDQQRQRDLEEEMERESREKLRRQQEEEYNRSVKADTAKDRQKEMEEIKRLDEIRRTGDLQEKRLREQNESQTRVPTEPADSEPNITKFKIRLPDQRILLRRFRLKDTLQNLFDYLSSEGQLFGEYRLLTAYPKRDLTTLTADVTLGALELAPQQLIVETI